MKNAFIMFGAKDLIPVSCVELLVMGIENVYDNKEYRFEIGNGKVFEIYDSVKFSKFHKKL